MSDAADDSSHVRDRSTEEDIEKRGILIRGTGTESGLALGADLEVHRPLLRLLHQPADVIVDQLCEGKPRDFAAECREHLRDNAYFMEEGRLAARVIATLAIASGTSGAEILEWLPNLIPDATSSLLENDPLQMTRSGREEESVYVAISRALGVELELAPRAMPILNSFEFGDRHVLFHCITEGLSPEAYARRFDDDPVVISNMLAEVARIVIRESQ